MLRKDRPRSAQTGWCSRRRLEFIDDSLQTLGYIRREMIANYFACDLSLASMDLTAYQQAGGKIHAEIGEMRPNGTLCPVGIKSGGKPYYMRDPDWRSVFGSTPERQQAWEHIAGEAKDNRQWFTDRRKDWVADHAATSPYQMAEYFGISVDTATREMRAIEGSGRNPTRAKAWEAFT